MRRNKALVVGIDKYTNSELDCCVNDATVISELLRVHGNGDPNFDVETMLNVGNKINLNKAICELFASDDDIQLLYFAGHGIVNERGGYLATIDCEKFDEGISMADIMNFVCESKAKNIVIILDCCHSGEIAKFKQIVGSSVLKDGMTILTACREAETSKECIDKNHGVFTSLLIDALQGGAADFSGNISPGSIYSYIDKSLGSWDQQRPVFKTNVSQFVTLRMVEPKVPKEILRKIPEYFKEPTAEYLLDPSYEDTNSLEIEHKVVEPYATEDNVRVFKHLQKLQSIGMVTPLGEDHMYYAAMNSKACKLTAIGAHYWKLVKKNRI